MNRCAIPRTLILIVTALLWTLPGAAIAQETVSVTVLPFDVYAQEGREYLQEKLPEVIRNFLKEEGASITDSGIPAGTPWTAVTRKAGGIRQFGQKLGADYVIWGSLTRVGDKISVDARMIATAGQESPAAFFEEGRGVENLSLTVQNLVRKFSLKLFKKERVAEVRVEGNRRIESDAILKIIRTRPGDVFLAKSLSTDLKAVYAMGFFEDIRIVSDPGSNGKIIRFVVTEKPTVRRVRVSGNRIFEDKEILDALSLKTGAILNVNDIQSNIQRIESLYKDKNYHNVRVSYKVASLNTSQADVEFSIEEGGKVRIKEIRFEGNRAYKDDELKDLMKTSEKGFWSWLTSSGDLNRQDLDQDTTRVSAFYHNNGYMEARVGEPQVEYKGDWIYITVKIDEGLRYQIGEVNIRGDLIQDEAELAKNLKITKGKYYSREIIRGDAIRLNDIYSDAGYAYADIAPRVQKDTDRQVVNLTYDIKKGSLVYFEQIVIGGNTKTRDKVIRRQLKVYEKDLYSGKDLKRSIRNLHRLDYFEDIKVNTAKGSSDDRMVLKIDVTEKPTGTFSFGGGYSSTDKMFGMASITQNNLFGLGQILQLRAELGGSSNRFTLSFTEPWLFDIPLSAGFDVYKWERDYDTYDKDSTGAAIRFGYPVYDYTRLYLTYRYDVGDIRNITDDAAREIRDLEGENITSSITTTLRYDSRDKAFNPNEGGNHSLSLEYAGIGGDIAFTKVEGELGQYFPLFWGTVGFVRAKGGYVQENTGGKLPDYEKFYLGGINSLRGFDWRDISLKDEDGAEIGGNKFVQFNVEYLVPLIKEAGVVGVLFFDTGNVYDGDQNIDWGELRESAGAGFRWYSPMGPIRVEYGYILDRKEGEDSGRWEFSMGNAF